MKMMMRMRMMKMANLIRKRKTETIAKVTLVNARSYDRIFVKFR